MEVTIAEIAKRLSLSSATISRSLGHSLRVHANTRARVAEMALELGYQGRSRRQKRKGKEATWHIGVVLQSHEYQSSINAIEILEGMTAEADGAGVALHIGLPPQQTGQEIKLPQVCTGEDRCDLTMLMGRHHPEMVAELVRHGPVVSATTRYAGVPHDHADTADYWGLYELATQILNAGHRKLVWAAESKQNTGPFDDLRRAGFAQACLHQGVDPAKVPLVTSDEFDDQGHLFADHIRPLIDGGATCFVCATDRVAFEVLTLLHQWGIDVPGQISVTGFDAVQAYTSSNPPRLTSVDPLWVEIGRAAMSLAVNRLAQPAAPQMTLTISPRFVKGETLGPARGPALGRAT